MVAQFCENWLAAVYSSGPQMQHNSILTAHYCMSEITIQEPQDKLFPNKLTFQLALQVVESALEAG